VATPLIPLGYLPNPVETPKRTVGHAFQLTEFGHSFSELSVRRFRQGPD